MSHVHNDKEKMKFTYTLNIILSLLINKSSFYACIYICFFLRMQREFIIVYEVRIFTLLICQFLGMNHQHPLVEIMEVWEDFTQIPTASFGFLAVFDDLICCLTECSSNSPICASISFRASWVVLTGRHKEPRTFRKKKSSWLICVHFKFLLTYLCTLFLFLKKTCLSLIENTFECSWLCTKQAVMCGLDLYITL